MPAAGAKRSEGSVKRRPVGGAARSGVAKTPAAKTQAAKTRAVKPLAAKRGEQTSRDLLLAAAHQEFASRGFEGARVDTIAAVAGVNKQLVYHHFGNKDDLYAKVLERAYDGIRERERSLDLGQLKPAAAMRRLIEMSFDYLAENRDFVFLLTDENLHRGKHLKQIVNLQRLNTPLLGTLDDILKRGAEEGLFRKGMDPLQVYISIAGLGFFYFNNIYTLSAIFGRNLDGAAEVAVRRRHVVEMMMSALRP